MPMLTPTLYIRKASVNRHSIYVKNVASVLIKRKTLINIREFIMERRSMDVRNVGRISVLDHIAWYIRGFTLGWNHAYVKNVLKPSVGSQTWFSSGGFTPERNPLNVRNVTQVLNLGLPHCRQTLYRLSRQGSPSQNTSHTQRQAYGFSLVWRETPYL